MDEEKFERRWLVNTKTKRVQVYVIDKKTKALVPTVNLNIGSLNVDRKYIKTGYTTQEAAYAEAAKIK